MRGRGGEQFISPGVQREQIERWASLRGVTIVEWHTDLDQSGSKSQRPGLLGALERIESAETGGVVVSKLDRFARSLTGALEALQRIEAAGGVFSSVAEGFDPTTPAGKMHLRLMLVLAEWELDRIRENWRVARERAVHRGVHIASRAPTGYRRRKDGVLELDPESAPVVRQVFECKAAGASWRELAALLNEAGVATPYGSPYWRPRAVSHVIENRAYLGEARHGEFSNADAHPALLDRTTWDRAQAVRGPPAARSNEPALLAGLLRCAGCRYVMKPDRMKLRNGENVRMYRCRGEHAAGKCDDRASALGTVIEPYVEDLFFEHAGERVATAEQRDLDVDRCERDLAEADAQLAAYRDDERILGVLGTERYVEGLRVRVAAAETAASAFAELQGARDRSLPGRAELSALWPELAVNERQRLLGSFIDAIFLRSGKRLSIDCRALVLWRGQAPDDLPARGRRVALRRFDWPHEVPGDVGLAAPQDV